ncbi:MAG: acyl-CoA dehydrogenase, partial [Betaproteobacteria bacterium]|nr:acyl-CoA dehydrogenase [Betaproteobacteria bacterium]
MITYFIAGAVALFFLCAYLRLPIWGWTIVFGALVAATGSVALIVVFLLFAAVLNVPVLRRAVISNHILAVYRRILPDMSQTEKEAIDAGTVWWDADHFSGRPDWDKLLAVREPRLSAEEQA